MPEHLHDYLSPARAARTAMRASYRDRLIAKGCSERKAYVVAWRRYP